MLLVLQSMSSLKIDEKNSLVVRLHKVPYAVYDISMLIDGISVFDICIQNIRSI